MKKQLVLILFAWILAGISSTSSIAAQNRGRAAATSRQARARELGSVEKLKAAFQSDTGKVRLVALVSPT